MEREEKHKGKIITIMRHDGTLDRQYQSFHDQKGDLTIYRSRTFQYKKSFVIFTSDDQRLSFKTTAGTLSQEGHLYTLVTAGHIYVFETED